MIYPKQKLRVSSDLPVALASGTPATGTPATGASKSEYIYYTVKKGDTLWDIANLYKGVSVDDIKKWNNMGSSSRLQVGQKLKINKNG